MVFNNDMVGGRRPTVSPPSPPPLGFTVGLIDAWQLTLIDNRLLVPVENDELDEIDDAIEFDDERRELMEPIEGF